MRRGLLAALLAAALPGAAMAERSGAAFLKIAPGARPAGLGDAFAAVADDANAAYFNPAGLSRLGRREALGAHQSHLQGLRYEYAALAWPLASRPDAYGRRTSWGTLALAVTNLSVSGLERRGVVETDAPVDTFGASDLAYGAAYAYSVSSAASLGLAGKWIDQRLDDARASAFALDAGGLWRRGRLSLALGLRHLGSSARFREASDPLPRTFYVGAAASVRPGWLAALEARLPRDEGLGVSLGVEHKRRLDHRVQGCLRAGFNTARRDAGGLAGLSLGAGLEVAASGAGVAGLAADFAWVPMGRLGDTFRYSLSVRF